MEPLLEVIWASKTLSWGRLVSNKISYLNNTVLLCCIAIDVLSILNAHWSPVTLIILLDGKLSAPTWTNVASNWSCWSSVIWYHIAVKAQLCLPLEHSMLAVVVYYRGDINGIHPVEIFPRNLFDRFVCVFDYTNVTIFIHQWISSLKSFFKIRIQWLFSHDVGDTTILVGYIFFLVQGWLLVALSSVEWPLCVILKIWAHLIWWDQFCGRLLILVKFFSKVNPFDLLYSLLLFDVWFHSFIFDWR